MRAWVRVIGITAVGGTVALGGCDAISAGGEAASSALEAVQSAFQAGKVDRWGNVSIEQSIAATRAAGNDLALKFIRTSIHPDQQKIVFQDGRGQDVVVTLVRRTGRMTEMRVDVGLFGPEGFGRLMLDRVLAHLPKASVATGAAGTQSADEQ